MGPPQPSSVVRIVLADPHDLLRSGVKTVLGMAPNVQVVGETRTGAGLLTLADSLTPDVVITEVEMPGMDAVGAIEQIHRSRPGIIILVLSMNDRIDVVRRAIEAGANGYVLKDAPTSELGHALRELLANGTYFSPTIAQRLLLGSTAAEHDELTERQLRILKLIALGRGTKEIAYELCLSRKTVDVHRSRIMDRLQVKDIAGLTRYAVRSGLITP